jgi:hypothetical protein
MEPSVPAIAFAPARGPVTGQPVALDCLPHDALIFWENELADQYTRVVGLTGGNCLKLVKITAGRGSGMEVICEAALVDDTLVLSTEFVRQDALVVWAEPRPPHGVGKTIVLRTGPRLQMIRVTGNEAAPAIEILHSLDITA